ncbi:MAG TPA: virulence RhuM family protein [Thermoanaerobaculia bacterium]|nr:virulence RhuM family protein [Thermoanaerobaculia bacterium]
MRPEKGGGEPAGELILYQTEDGQSRIECRFDRGSLWLTQTQLAELYQTSIPNIVQHIRNILREGEVDPSATTKNYLIVRREGDREVRRTVKHYSLEMILAVGYRVRSERGTVFRQWATARLSEFLVKGFVLDDQRLKSPPGPGVPDYFDELLARIRDIRSSEKVFYRKVLDIYATSIDYDPAHEASQRFFATVQNKMHWAIHGQTAAEVVVRRADAAKPNMGLTSWAGTVPRSQDAVIAKNYLTADELERLNRIVTAYLEFAELQALSRKPMYMAQWIAKLDDFLRLSEHEILTHAGTVSHEAALAKANEEYEKFRTHRAALPSRAERDFENAIKKLPGPKPTSQAT